MRALLLLALLLAWPMAAWADPIALIGIGAGLGFTGTTALVVGAVVSYGGYAVLAASYIYGGMDARRRARNQAADARNAYNAGLQDRNTSVLQADPPWRVVYGACRTGGDIVAIFTSDKTGTRTDGSSYTKPDAYKHLVVVVAAHEVDDITEMYVDGVAVGTLDGSGWATTGDLAQTRTQHQEVRIAAGASVTFPGTPTVLAALDSATFGAYPGDSGYTAAAITYNISGNAVTNTDSVEGVFSVTYPLTTGVLRWGKHLGTSSQTADAYLLSVVPSQWTSADRLRGLAYVVVTLDLEDQRFQGGPPQMSWDVRGRKCYDPRTGTVVWTQNPAVIVRDYLKEPWGFECGVGDVDDDYVIAAANACDVSITLTAMSNGSPVTWTGPTYTCNGALVSTDSREKVLNDLCDSMAGYAVYGARWQVMAGVWSAPVLSLTDADLAGQIEIVQAGASLDEVFNGIRGSYVPGDSGVMSDFSYANSTFVTADGRELWTEVALPYTNSAARCRNLARIMVEANRDSQVIRMPCTLRAWPLQVGDRVTVTSAEYGLSAKTYRVTDWAFGLQTPVLLTLQEDAAAIYDLADAAEADPAPNTGLPNPFVVATVSGLSASSGNDQLQVMADGAIVARVKVSWSAVTDAYVADGSGRIEVKWRRVGQDDANTWRTVIVPGDATSAFLQGTTDGEVVTVCVTAINGLGARGAPAYLSHAVVGKSQAPDNVAGLSVAAQPGGVSISWTPCVNLDYLQTEVRIGASWAAGTRLYAGRGTSFVWPWPAAGTYTVRVRHRDSSGNESAAEATASITVSATNTLIGWDLLSGRPKTYRVAARGASCTSYPIESGLYDGDSGDVIAARARSWMVAAIERSSKTLTFFDTFDLFGGTYTGASSGQSMATVLNNQTSSKIVVVWTYDEPQTNRGNSGIAAAMYRCGASQAVFGSPEFKYRSAYVLVGIGGCGEGNGYESYQGSVDNDVDAWVDVAFQITEQGHLLVTGTGATPRTLADYAAGALAYLSTVDTDEIAAGAATAVYSGSNSNINVTGNTGVPTGDFTDLVSYTFTPSVTCEVLVTVEGSAEIVTPASGALADYASFTTRLIANSTTLGTTFNYAVDDKIGYSSSIRVGISRAQSFSATGGVSYTVKVQGQQLTNLVTTTVTDINLRIEEIRR